MEKPWEKDNCGSIKSHFPYYKVYHVALLWCGVPQEDVDEILAEAKPSGESNTRLYAILTHPDIPCLEPRCRAIHDAIDHDQLPVGRDGGKTRLQGGDRVAYERRTIIKDDLKKWISNTFPDDKPSFLFDEVERNIHPAITPQSYLTLKADYDLMKEKYEQTSKQLQNIIDEREHLAKTAKKAPGIGDRKEETYLHIIGVMLELMTQKGKYGKPKFPSQKAITDAMVQQYGRL